ncbi:Ger(x)C family spore germination protein [Virgibacillus ainsalahensis]
MGKYKFLWISCVLVFLLTGCWDRQEIEDRGFIVGVAIDLAENHNNGRYSLLLTEQIVIPSRIGAPTQSGGGEQEAYMNVSESGQAIYAIHSEISKKTSRSPSPEHVDVLPVSAEVAKEPGLFGNVMDVFLRDQEMRRGIHIVIAAEDAKGLFDINPKNEQFPVRHIESILENSDRNSAIIDPVRLGDVHEYLLMEQSFILPQMVITEDNKIGNEGVAVFRGKNNQLVGSLDGDETKGLNFITGENQEGILEVSTEDTPVSITIRDGKRKITVDKKDENNIVFHVDLEVSGTIAEVFSSKDIFNPESLAKIESSLEDEIENLARASIDKVQNDFKVDVFGFGPYLHRHHYEFWQTVKDNWDHGENYFEKSQIDVSVTAEIEESGNIQQQEKED